jgi:hypothetical protein
VIAEKNAIQFNLSQDLYYGKRGSGIYLSVLLFTCSFEREVEVRTI